VVIVKPIDYFKKHERSHVSKVAEAAGTNFAYFEQLARGYRSPSLKLAKRLARETGGVVPIQEWIPELKNTAA